MGLSRYLSKLAGLVRSDGKLPAAALADGAALSLGAPNGSTRVDCSTAQAMPLIGNGFQHAVGYGPNTNDGHIMSMSWDDVTKYGVQMWFDTDPTYQTAFRQRSSLGTWNPWTFFLHQKNFKVYTANGGSSTTTSGITRQSVSIDLLNASNKIMVFGSDLFRTASGTSRMVLKIDGVVAENEFMYQQANGNIWQTTTGIYTGNNLAVGTRTVALESFFDSSSNGMDGPTYLQVLVWDGV